MTTATIVKIVQFVGLKKEPPNHVKHLHVVYFDVAINRH